MRYFLIAGEPSGDLHASYLMEKLKEVDKNAVFSFVGGDLMIKQDGHLVMHYKNLAIMGIMDVIKRIHTIKKKFDFCVKQIISDKPDVVILVDYPGFNLRIAKFAKKKGFKVFYYISPKIWARNEKRIRIIKKYIDRLYVIFPFEIDYYKKFNYPVIYKGNPLVDYVDFNKSKNLSFEQFCKKNNLESKPIIAVLPGSRITEVKRILSKILSTLGNNYPDFQIVIAGVSNIDTIVYEKIVKNFKCRILYNQTYDILNFAYIAIVASGTATLETALFKVPQVVCYYLDKFTYILARQIVKVKYISLVNLLLNEPLVKELIQENMNSSILRNEIDKLLFDDGYRNKILEGYDKIEHILENPGVSYRIAEDMYYSIIK